MPYEPSHVRYINLKYREDRNEIFLKRNSGNLSLERIDAVVGKDLSVSDLIRDKLIHEPLQSYSPGALGCAISHKKLWDLAVKQGTPVTVAEDDAIFNRHFCQKASDLLKRLPESWDIILWGWNFDSFFHVEVISKLKQGVMTFDHTALGQRASDFQNVEFNSLLFRLVGAFGTVCYSLSTKGANRLSELCFPLKNEVVNIPGLGKEIPNIGIDTVLNKHYPAVQAFACFPPLVWSDNDKTRSDVG